MFPIYGRSTKLLGKMGHWKQKKEKNHRYYASLQFEPSCSATFKPLVIVQTVVAFVVIQIAYIAIELVSVLWTVCG